MCSPASTWGSPPPNKKALSFFVYTQLRFACAVGLGPWSSPRPPSKHLHNTIYSVNNTIYPVNIAWS